MKITLEKHYDLDGVWFKVMENGVLLNGGCSRNYEEAKRRYDTAVQNKKLKKEPEILESYDQEEVK
jgi:hypothetical protein